MQAPETSRWQAIHLTLTQHLVRCQTVSDYCAKRMQSHFTFHHVSVTNLSYLTNQNNSGQRKLRTLYDAANQNKLRLRTICLVEWKMSNLGAHTYCNSSMQFLQHIHGYMICLARGCLNHESVSELGPG